MLANVCLILSCNKWYVTSDMNPCRTNHPCLNGGVCSYDGPFNYTCNCISNYTNTHCEDGEFLI